MAQVFIGLGSNLNDPLSQIITAMTQIELIATTHIIKKSSLFKSKAIGEADQPDYINAVIKIVTQLEPLKLLDALQKIEDEHQRQRGKTRWRARTLDLDMLLYDDRVIHIERLVIPHYQMHLRNFVLVPLYEIDPELIMPSGTPLSVMPLVHDMSGLIKLV
jgi:2-amino-4-hydroxy-6-hydroxymethyldihydropteridine diphosphokinase